MSRKRKRTRTPARRPRRPARRARVDAPATRRRRRPASVKARTKARRPATKRAVIDRHPGDVPPSPPVGVDPPAPPPPAATTGKNEGTVPAVEGEAMETTYRLPATFDISTAPTVRRELLALPGRVRIDGREVVSADTAGVQLLVALALGGRAASVLASPSLAHTLSLTAAEAVVPLEH